MRLAHSALAMHYKKAIAWKSPSFKAAKSLATTTDGADGGRSTVSVSVQLNDVSPAGLRTADPYNYNPATVHSPFLPPMQQLVVFPKR